MKARAISFAVFASLLLTLAPPDAAAVAPPAPAFCTATTTTFTNNTAVAIPSGPVVVTSTIGVAGLGAYLFDLDMTTFLTHTWSADLYVTIQSPAGTVVTLTTGNGGEYDDVFNGTVWDDDANPGGQVPYSTNNGLATDHNYFLVNPATLLVPEEALGAFLGEDPNGTWTLTIADQFIGESGSLDSWSLHLTTIDQAPSLATTGASNNTPVAIVDLGVTTSTIEVSGAGGYLFDVDVTTFITHTYSSDLDITVQSPAGTVVTLTTDNGGSLDNVFNGTLWDDDANPGGQVPYTTNDGLVTDHAYVDLTLASPLVPEEALAAFVGENPNGTWTITISDPWAGDTGSLDSWSLDIETATCTPPPLSVLEIPTLDGIGLAALALLLAGFAFASLRRRRA